MFRLKNKINNLNLKLFRNIITITTINNSIIKLSLNSLPVNSLDLNLIKNLTHHLNEINLNNNYNNISSIILTSSCRVFSAGLNLNCLYNKKTNELIEFWSAFQDLCFLLYGNNKFIIAEIGGHAPAAGTILSLCCDMRIALNGSKLGLNESAFGLVCPIWACDMLTDLVGSRVAYKSLCQGTLYSTEESLKLGLIDSIVNDKQTLENEVIFQCNEWTKHSGRAPTKSLLRESNLTRWKKERHIDLDNFVNLIQKEETQQSIKTYLQSLKK